MSNAVAFFPFCQPSQLPAIRHFNNMQSNYNLQQLISWKGTGLHKKDAARICNHPPTGFIVSDEIDLQESTWGTVIVDFLEVKNKSSTMDVPLFLKNCLDMNKHILILSNTNKDESIILKNDSPNISFLFSETSVKHDLATGLSYSSLDVPVLLVGGLVGKSDSLEVIFTLKELFACDGVSVSCFTNSNLGLLFGMHSYNFIFDNNRLAESEKILMLNQVARDIIRSERPELLIVEAPDNVMKYSDIAPNEFGIRTYMVSLALNPQCFICCIPFNFISQGFIEAINQDIKNKYGFSISAVNVSNIWMDYLAIIQEQSVSYVHTDLEYMHHFLGDSPVQSSIPLYDVVSDGATKLYRYICDLLK